MSIIAATCPKCGASLQMLDNAEQFFCQYCGAKIIKDIDYVHVSGPVNVQGIASAESLLERAYIFISDGKFEKAAEYIEKVLDINPRYAKAYFGKFLCQARVRSTDELMERVVNPLKYNSYKRAVQFASGSQKQEYEAIAERLEEPVLEKKQMLLDNIKRYTDEIEQLNKSKERIMKQIKWSENLALGRSLFFVIPLVLFIISLIGVFSLRGSDILIGIFFLILPLGCVTYFSYRRIVKVNQLPVDLENTNLQIEMNYDDLHSAKAELEML
ncbi:MAG: hypothetical protein AB1Z23_03315 [Eubacteriales bacterium]